jgi:acetyltransferase-like isoleucine patch superfamily enzyme
VYPGARIVPNRSIGDGAVVGIGSVVLLNVQPGTTVFGNPAAPQVIPS